MSDEFEYYEEDFEHVPMKRKCSTDEYNARLRFNEKHPSSGGNMYTTSEVIDIIQELKNELLQIAREADLNTDKIQERIEELKEDKVIWMEHNVVEQVMFHEIKIKRKQGVLDLIRRIENL